jgi:hypothetical protein
VLGSLSEREGAARWKALNSSKNSRLRHRAL